MHIIACIFIWPYCEILLFIQSRLASSRDQMQSLMKLCKAMCPNKDDFDIKVKFTTKCITIILLLRYTVKPLL